jgi:hypothetical protein
VVLRTGKVKYDHQELLERKNADLLVVPEPESNIGLQTLVTQLL